MYIFNNKDQRLFHVATSDLLLLLLSWKDPCIWLWLILILIKQFPHFDMYNTHDTHIFKYILFWFFSCGLFPFMTCFFSCLHLQAVLCVRYVASTRQLCHIPHSLVNPLEKGRKCKWNFERKCWCAYIHSTYIHNMSLLIDRELFLLMKALKIDQLSDFQITGIKIW